MNSKEQLKFDHVMAENCRLRAEIDKHFQIYAGTLSENVELKARLETLSEVMGWPYGEEYKKNR